MRLATTRALLLLAGSALAALPAASIAQQTPAVSVPAPVAPPTVRFGKWGVDTSARDLKVRPGDDFERYASGAWLDANEIPADIVRWSGADAVTAFLDELIRGAKAEDPELLCTFGNFPTTEFLQAKTADFLCFNEIGRAHV